MLKNNIYITYLYNSGFIAETEKHLMIFDFCLGVSDVNTINATVLKSKPYVTVFVSHAHRDHFNPMILRWRVRRPDIQYIFSDDIPELDNVIRMRSGEAIEINNMNIIALPSTDIGVSFLVTVDGFVIYHAGDLNYWNWQQENNSIEEYQIRQRKAKIAFQRALYPLRKEEIDVAFFPVDPQIGSNYDEGAIYFINNFSPKVFVPMHFRREYAVCEKLRKKLGSSESQVFCISHVGQVFSYHKG